MARTAGASAWYRRSAAVDAGALRPSRRHVASRCSACYPFPQPLLLIKPFNFDALGVEGNGIISDYPDYHQPIFVVFRYKMKGYQDGQRK
jgi:hypothetical protein